MPPMSRRSAEAITWIRNRPAPMATANATVIPRYVPQPAPPIRSAVAWSSWPHSQAVAC